jgi:quercetin dioxygenase-like cupin family protein
MAFDEALGNGSGAGRRGPAGRGEGAATPEGAIRRKGRSDPAKEAEPTDKGILGRTLFNEDRLKVVLFGFARDEEMSEHTASTPAVLQLLQGEAKLTLGDDKHEAAAGT